MNKDKQPKIFIVGAGSSLYGFDFERLRNKGKVIVINDSLYKIPWADTFFTGDYRWVNNRKDLLASFAGEIYLALTKPNRPPLNYHFLDLVFNHDFTDAPHSISLGGNSGYGALNLAYHFNPAEIYLLGYDYCGVRHYQNYEWDTGLSKRYYRNWARSFEKSVSFLKEKSIEVYNCSEVSKITCFPKLSLGEI